MHRNSLTAIPIQQLKRAIAIREQIDELTRELNDLTGGSKHGAGNGNGHHSLLTHRNGSKARGLTSAGRARIAAAQRLRWSRYNAKNGGSRISAKTTDGERLSAAGRAKVSAAVKARWERYRAAKAKSK